MSSEDADAAAGAAAARQNALACQARKKNTFSLSLFLTGIKHSINTILF